MKSGTESKGKFKRLKRRLNLPLFQVVGILQALWNLTAASAQDGGIGRLSNEDIAAALEWPGDECELVALLLECDWLDPYQDGEIRFVVHDWEDHAPNYIKANFAKHRKKFLVSPKRAERLAKEAALGASLVDCSGNVPEDGATKSSQVKSSQETPPPNPTEAPRATPSGGVSGVGVGGDFWKSAREATERIGLTSAGFVRLHAKCCEKGISPAEVEAACRHASSGAFDNPAGVLASWVGVHEINRAVDDKRSWPANGRAATTKREPTAEEKLTAICSRAIHLAKSNLGYAVEYLRQSGLPEGKWPAAIVERMPKPPP